MYSISLLLTAEQCSLVWIYHLLFNPSLLIRKWDFITQKNLLTGLSFLYTVTSSVSTAQFYCFDTHTQLSSGTRRATLTPRPNPQPTCTHEGGQVSTKSQEPRPWARGEKLAPCSGLHNQAGVILCQSLRTTYLLSCTLITVFTVP